MIGSNSHIWTPLNIGAVVMFDPTIQGNIINNLPNYGSESSISLNVLNSSQTNETDNYRRNWDFINDGVNNLKLNGASYQRSFLTNDFSMFFRVKFDNLGVFQCLTGNINTTANRGVWRIRIENTNQISFANLPTGGTVAIADSTNASLSTGVWYNILVTKQGNTIKTYQDNVSLIISYTNQSLIDSNFSNMYTDTNQVENGVMSVQANVGSNFNTSGNLESLVWFDKVLSDNERDLLHNYYTFN